MRHSQRNQTSMGLSNTEMETTKLNQKENLVTNRITSPCRSPIDIQPPSQSLKKKRKKEENYNVPPHYLKLWPFST